MVSTDQRRWIVINALLVTAVVNVVINGALGWLSVGEDESVPLWDFPGASTLSDALGTLFVLPLITGLLATTAVWVDMRRGRLERVRGLAQRRPRLAALPLRRLPRAIAFGAITFVLLAPPVALALVLTDFDDLSRGEFVVYKVVFAVVLGALVTPVIALRAMADRIQPSEEHRPRE